MYCIAKSALNFNTKHFFKSRLLIALLNSERPQQFYKFIVFVYIEYCKD